MCLVIISVPKVYPTYPPRGRAKTPPTPDFNEPSFKTFTFHPSTQTYNTQPRVARPGLAILQVWE